MNANLVLNSISFPLSSNKLDEVKKYILTLPWENKPNPEAIEKMLKAPEIIGRWIECPVSTTRKYWFRMIELMIKDYIIILTSTEHPKTGWANRISWQRKNDALATSKEW